MRVDTNLSLTRHTIAAGRSCVCSGPLMKLASQTSYSEEKKGGHSLYGQLVVSTHHREESFSSSKVVVLTFLSF